MFWQLGVLMETLVERFFFVTRNTSFNDVIGGCRAKSEAATDDGQCKLKANEWLQRF